MGEEYQILDRKTKYDGPKVKVGVETIRLPNGKIVEWDVVDYPDIVYGIPVTKDGCVLMVQEWRQGPEKVMTQFVGARVNRGGGIDELKRELREELGIKGGNYEKIVSFYNGVRHKGKKSLYLVKDFELGETDRDEDEIQKMVKIPIKGLYLCLSSKHVVTADALLGAKLIEEMLGR